MEPKGKYCPNQLQKLLNTFATLNKYVKSGQHFTNILLLLKKSSAACGPDAAPHARFVDSHGGGGGGIYDVSLRHR